jgi:hypothetical protein
VIADVCPWCAGGSRHSDWRPYCSAGCEYNGALNAVLADGEAAGRAAERAAVVAWLREKANAEHPIERGVPSLSPVGRGLLLLCADHIERGAHIGAAGGAR